MDFILETKRLILRKPRLSDAKDIIEGIGDFEISKNLSKVPYPYKKKDAEIWIKRSIKKSKRNVQDGYNFILELKSDKKVIGCLGIHKLNKQQGVCETGSWLNRKYHRKGYMTEAKIAVNELVFNQLKMRKMETEAFADNKASNATQRAVGYKYEGCRKKHSVSQATGKIHNNNLYGLLKEDWKKNLPKLKKHLEEKIRKIV